MTITRFAPSPTGRLHVGNIRTALHNWMLAQNAGGEFLLRIDDTDAARSKEEYVEAIRTDLAWLGIHADKEERQSARLDRYEAAFERLVGERGCEKVVVSTYSFQAPGFYRKLGFEVRASVDGYPGGVSRRLMEKVL